MISDNSTSRQFHFTQIVEEVLRQDFIREFHTANRLTVFVPQVSDHCSSTRHDRRAVPTSCFLVVPSVRRLNHTQDVTEMQKGQPTRRSPPQAACLHHPRRSLAAAPRSERSSSPCNRRAMTMLFMGRSIPPGTMCEKFVASVVRLMKI